MGRQPPAGVVIPDTRGTASNTVRVDERGFVILSEWDIERIATAVAEKMRAAPVESAASIEDSYIPVRRNAPQRPMSEY